MSSSASIVPRFPPGARTQWAPLQIHVSPPPRPVAGRVTSTISLDAGSQAMTDPPPPGGPPRPASSSRQVRPSHAQVSFVFGPVERSRRVEAPWRARGRLCPGPCRSVPEPRGVEVADSAEEQQVMGRQVGGNRETERRSRLIGRRSNAGAGRPHRRRVVSGGRRPLREGNCGAGDRRNGDRRNEHDSRSHARATGTGNVTRIRIGPPSWVRWVW